jgi:hypothetical protein
MTITMTAMQITSSSHMANRIQLNHKQLLQALLVVTSILMQPMEAIRTMLPCGIPASKPNTGNSKQHKIKAHQVSRGLQARDIILVLYLPPDFMHIIATGREPNVAAL